MQDSQNSNFDPSSPAQEREWIREARIIYGGLAGLGLIMIQPFMYEGRFTDRAAEICVFSFAISTPIFAALLLLNREEDFVKRTTKSIIVAFSRSLAQLAAAVGFVAGLWHINPLAGKIAAVSCIFAVCAHSAGYAKLFVLKNKK